MPDTPRPKKKAEAEYVEAVQRAPPSIVPEPVRSLRVPMFDWTGHDGVFSRWLPSVCELLAPSALVKARFASAVGAMSGIGARIGMPSPELLANRDLDFSYANDPPRPLLPKDEALAQRRMGIIPGVRTDRDQAPATAWSEHWPQEEFARANFQLQLSAGSEYDIPKRTMRLAMVVVLPSATRTGFRVILPGDSEMRGADAEAFDSPLVEYGAVVQVHPPPERTRGRGGGGDVVVMARRIPSSQCTDAAFAHQPETALCDDPDGAFVFGNRYTYEYPGFMHGETTCGTVAALRWPARRKEPFVFLVGVVAAANASFGLQIFTPATPARIDLSRGYPVAPAANAAPFVRKAAPPKPRVPQAKKGGGDAPIYQIDD